MDHLILLDAYFYKQQPLDCEDLLVLISHSGVSVRGRPLTPSAFHLAREANERCPPISSQQWTKRKTSKQQPKAFLPRLLTKPTTACRRVWNSTLTRKVCTITTRTPFLTLRRPSRIPWKNTWLGPSARSKRASTKKRLCIPTAFTNDTSRTMKDAVVKTAMLLPPTSSGTPCLTVS